MPPAAITIAQALQRGRGAIGAEILLCDVLDCERVYLLSHPEQTLTAEQRGRYLALLEKRHNGVPVQYLTGRQEFFGRIFTVSPDVLIPRPETELLVEEALRRLDLESTARVIDVGTGSGCIAITLKLERPGIDVTATDVSALALTMAATNASRLRAQVRFIQTDLLRGAGSGLDLVISNPPYVAESEFDAMQIEVRDHEPRVALAGGSDGNEVYRRLIPAAAAVLRPGGMLLLELGYQSETAVRACLDSGWVEVATRTDLQGWPRVLYARRR